MDFWDDDDVSVLYLLRSCCIFIIAMWQQLLLFGGFGACVPVEELAKIARHSLPSLTKNENAY